MSSRFADLLLKRLVCRDDAYAIQGVNVDGDAFYEPARIGGKDQALTILTLEQHVRGGAGSICVGTYVLNGDQAKLVALDIDGKGGDPEQCREATLALVRTARHFEIEPLVEWSGKKGYRLWWLCERMPAAIVRAVGYGVIAEAGEAGQDGCEEVAVFPKQSRVTPGGYGNLLKLPWGKRADNGQRGLFCDPDTLTPYPQEAQADALANAPEYTLRFFSQLCAENGWHIRDPREVSLYRDPNSSEGPGGGTRTGATFGSPAFREQLPCYAAMEGSDPPIIPQGGRNNVLFALAGQERRMGSRASAAIASLRVINERLCKPPLDVRELDALVYSAYKATVTSAGCDNLTPAGLCVARTHGVMCPIFEAQREKQQQVAEQLATDPTRFTITPMSIMKTDPAWYTVTVQGCRLTISGEQLRVFAQFQTACLNAALPIPTLPKIKGQTAAETWTQIVNEAHGSHIHEDAPPEDVSPAGIMWDAIAGFIASCRPTEDRDKLGRGQILLEEGRHYFRGADLLQYLKLNQHDALPPSRIWKLVRDRGGMNIALRTPEKVLKVWVIPQSALGEAHVTAEPNASLIASINAGEVL